MIPINPTTDAAAVLARVMAEPISDEFFPDEDFRAAIAEIGIPRQRLARMLGYSARGFRHLALDRPVPRSVAIIVKLLQLRKISVKTIERLMADNPRRYPAGGDCAARGARRHQALRPSLERDLPDRRQAGRNELLVKLTNL
jgi:hypothetical protein